ncbi:MAG: hypothetical protein ACHP6H_03190 [Legionellales bacterium]
MSTLCGQLIKIKTDPLNRLLNKIATKTFLYAKENHRRLTKNPHIKVKVLKERNRMPRTLSVGHSPIHYPARRITTITIYAGTTSDKVLL